MRSSKQQRWWYWFEELIELIYYKKHFSLTLSSVINLFDLRDQITNSMLVYISFTLYAHEYKQKRLCYLWYFYLYKLSLIKSKSSVNLELLFIRQNNVNHYYSFLKSLCFCLTELFCWCSWKSTTMNLNVLIVKRFFSACVTSFIDVCKQETFFLYYSWIRLNDLSSCCPGYSNNQWTKPIFVLF